MPDIDKDLLRRLCLAGGPPGAEDEVRAIVRGAVAETGDIQYDRMGSLLCERRGSADGPRVMLDSHLDEVGFMIQSISSEGRLGFVTLGGWWGHVLLGQRVDILTDGGRVPAVVGATPPHHLKESERAKVISPDKMYFDVGASNAEQVQALGVRVGDPAVPASDFRDMAVDGVVSCKAFDNRAGVGLMCETLRTLAAGREHPNTVIGVAAAQEEVGCRGTGPATTLARPDVALVLECTPADDLPGFADRQGVLGGGPQIRHFDPTAISNRRLVRLVEETANAIGVDVQMAVRRSGGTDASVISKSGAGVPTVVIGVPARYIHTHVALMHWNDYAAARELCVEVVARLDVNRVAELTRFDQ